MPEQPTLEETMLRKAQSIGADKPEVLGRAIMVSPLALAEAAPALGAMGRAELPSLVNLLRHYKSGIGDAIIGSALRYGRDRLEQQTGAHLPRTIPEAWRLLMNRDADLQEARPQPGTYPIRIPQLNK